MIEEIDDIWDSVNQVENDANDILIGIELITDDLRDTDIGEDEEDFKISDKQIKKMLDRCEDISDRASLLDDSVEELRENIEKLKKVRILLALKENKNEN